MGFFKLAGMTFGNIFSKKETLRYPYQKKEPYPGQKGTIVQAHKDKCNLCTLCMKKCPVGAITVDKPNKTWSINHFECVQCGYCIDACAKKCLEMSGEKPPIGLQKEVETIDIPFEPKKPKPKTDVATKAKTDDKPVDNKEVESEKKADSK